MKLAKAPRKTIAKAVEPKVQEREAPWNKYHAAGAGFRAHGSADARFAKKSAAKRTAKKAPPSADARPDPPAHEPGDHAPERRSRSHGDVREL